MRIAINCRTFLKRQYDGIGRYTYNLVDSLSKIDDVNEYWLYVHKKYFDFKRDIPRIHAGNFTIKVDWMGRGIDRTLTPVDVYHSPAAEYVNVTGAKIIVTVHDLVFKTYPEAFTQKQIETADEQMNMIVEKADQIICCSQSTVRDLKEHYLVPDDQVSLVYQGVDKGIFYPVKDAEKRKAEEWLKKKGIGRPFILFVGGIHHRKNLHNLILAVSELKMQNKFNGRLVVVGMKRPELESLQKVIQNFNLEKEVALPGFVTDEELRYLYNLCEVFVFPSFYEGFGYPIVEAFCCGAAVVTSNRSSCPEIATDGALLIDPYNPTDIAQSIAHILNDPDLKKGLGKKALKRSEAFSFEKTAAETLKVYQNTCNR